MSPFCHSTRRSGKALDLARLYLSSQQTATQRLLSAGPAVCSTAHVRPLPVSWVKRRSAKPSVLLRLYNNLRVRFYAPVLLHASPSLSPSNHLPSRHGRSPLAPPPLRRLQVSSNDLAPAPVSPRQRICELEQRVGDLETQVQKVRGATRCQKNVN